PGQCCAVLSPHAASATHAVTMVPSSCHTLRGPAACHLPALGSAPARDSSSGTGAGVQRGKSDSLSSVLMKHMEGGRMSTGPGNYSSLGNTGNLSRSDSVDGSVSTAELLQRTGTISNTVMANAQNEPKMSIPTPKRKTTVDFLRMFGTDPDDSKSEEQTQRRGSLTSMMSFFHPQETAMKAPQFDTLAEEESEPSGTGGGEVEMRGISSNAGGEMVCNPLHAILQKMQGEQGNENKTMEELVAGLSPEELLTEVLQEAGKDINHLEDLACSIADETQYKDMVKALQEARGNLGRMLEVSTDSTYDINKFMGMSNDIFKCIQTAADVHASASTMVTLTPIATLNKGSQDVQGQRRELRTNSSHDLVQMIAKIKANMTSVIQQQRQKADRRASIADDISDELRKKLLFRRMGMDWVGKIRDNKSPSRSPNQSVSNPAFEKMKERRRSTVKPSMSDHARVSVAATFGNMIGILKAQTSQKRRSDTKEQRENNLLTPVRNTTQDFTQNPAEKPDL
ncbi:hypothetical protein CYMTET_21268, partial [Cymbomonas tetramitiformis]